MGLKQSSLLIQGSEKVKGLQLPGQSGKTRKMEERITNYMIYARQEGYEDDLNIIISSNNKILVDQTTSRFNNDLGPQTDTNNDAASLSSEFSEDSDDEIVILKNGASTWTYAKNRTEKEWVHDINEDDVDMIVCCANSKRFKKIFRVLELLEKSKHFHKNINIWIDEAHKSLKLWKKYHISNNNVLAFKKVKNVTLVTASWDPIDKFYNIHRIPYEFTHPDVYRPLNECDWHIIEPADFVESENEIEEILPFDNNSTAPRYLQQVLEKEKIKINGKIINCLDFIQQAGKCWFTPGNSTTVTHDIICNYLLDKGFNGIKLNGKAKELIYCDTTKSILSWTEYAEGKEPNLVLAKLFDEYPSLKNSPFFITGLNCVKEGLTFQGEKFMFDGGILPPMSNPSDAYQLACRLAGNLKSLPIYNTHSKPVIITTSKMRKMIIKQENININLPRILHEEGRTMPTQYDKNRAARGNVEHDHTKKRGFRIFTNYDHLVGFLKIFGYKTAFKLEPNHSLDEFKGKHVCSVQSIRGAKQTTRYLTEVIDKIELAYGGSGAVKRGLPCYLDIKNAPDGLVWLAVVGQDMVPPSCDQKKLVDADIAFPDEYDSLKSDAVDYNTIYL
jgi:hypothetical protein